MLRDAALACLAVLGLSVIAGCASTAGNGARDPAIVASDTVDTGLAPTIELMQRLVQGGPAEQAEALAGARRAYEAAPRGAEKLRYALALAAPAHPAREPQLAQRLLRELLAAPESLEPVERSIALVELQRVDAELRLTAENARLLAEAERERKRLRERPDGAGIAAINKRLQTQIDENTRLRKALDDARAKLDAIATIEQDITERKPTTEGRRQ